MSSELVDFMVHTVSVETYLGTGSTGGARYAAAETVPCFVDEQKQLNLSGDGSQQVVSATVFYVVDTSWAPKLAARSRVTLPDGTQAVIARAIVRTSGPLELPDHLEVRIT